MVRPPTLKVTSKGADYIAGFLQDHQHPNDNDKPSDEQRAA
jgi:hypothetical protein